MKPIYSLILLSIVLLFSGCKSEKKSEVKNQKSVNLIPFPNSIKMESGTFKYNTFNYSLPNEIKAMEGLLSSFFPDSKNTTSSPNLKFEVDNSLAEEAYQLKIGKENISIKSKNAFGALHAIQTLRQLMPNSESGEIACMTIDDKPRFSYRGMHLDVGRHFFDVTFIKRYIDILSMYKINNFHWHLTEDQGWRIEIKKYPRLQEVSAFRNETLIGHYNDQPQKFDGKKYGGYYTQEEVKEIVKYATERNINVIPEIEMPGHAQAAIAAYPELGCTGKAVQVAKKWGVFEDVFCPNQKTFAFLEDVLTEVMELFPSKYIHIGGDECPKTQWKNNAFCQALIKKENLKDEHGLQSYFIQKMEKFLNSKGRKIIGWDEILEGGLAPNATVMSWRGIEGGIAAAKQKHNVIMTPTDYCYLDYYQSKNPNEPLAIGGYLPLEKVYSYEPIPEKLNIEEAKYILGVQGNLWTEYLNTSQKVEYMVLPRMQALAEVGWTSKENKNYSSFTQRLIHHFEWWKKLGYNYADKSKELTKSIKAGEGKGVSLSLATNGSSLPIKYAIDGALIATSSEYKGDIKLDKSCKIIAAAYDGKTFYDADTTTFSSHTAAGKKITLQKNPSLKYSANGAGSLINGIMGPKDKYGNEWLGFEGDNCEATIDLGSSQVVNNIKTRFFNGPGQWIYPPKSVSIFFSQDGDKYNEIPAFTVKPNNSTTVDFSVPTANTRTRFIKIKIENFGIIPEGSQGAGHPAWLMVDEIVVD